MVVRLTCKPTVEDELSDAARRAIRSFAELSQAIGEVQRATEDRSAMYAWLWYHVVTERHDDEVCRTGSTRGMPVTRAERDAVLKFAREVRKLIPTSAGREESLPYREHGIHTWSLDRLEADFPGYRSVHTTLSAALVRVMAHAQRYTEDPK